MAAGEIFHRIHKLPDYLINQIAAGEVIERPASVIKELLENSLDAGATSITIEIRDSGSSLIRVQDDGHGIHADDLLLAVDRHTTSKLHDDAGLWRIKTLGFRGEALSSIAAVSRFTLTSRQVNVEYGWSVHVSSMDSTPVLQPASHPPGTTVEVKDLFYNIPARRKFLRSGKTEFIHIQELIKRIALSRFGLSIRLIHNGRQVFHFSNDQGNPLPRISSILGKQFQEKALQVSEQMGDMNLYGWIGLPEAARSQTDQQYFYLNGRIIRDKLINHAIRLASQDRIYPGRHPGYLLYLDMDVAAADINVHPSKQEVRFRNARNVHDFIYGSLHRKLHENSQKSMFSEQYHIRERGKAYSVPDTHIDTFPAHAGNNRSVISILGRYLIAEESDGMVLVDIHRARELILLARLKTALAEGSIRSRPVLVPLAFTVTPAEAELIEVHQVLLEKSGLIINHTAPTMLLIRELPVLLAGADAMALLRAVINVLKRTCAQDDQINNLLTVFSRHANDSSVPVLTQTEMNSLLADLDEFRKQISANEHNAVIRNFDIRALQGLLNGS